MAETSQLTTLTEVVAKVKASTDKALDGARYSVLHPDIAVQYGSAPARAIVGPLDDFYGQFDEMRSTLADVAGKVRTTLTDPALVPAQREKDAAALVAAARTSAQANLAAMKVDADRIVNTLRPLAMPPRPTPDAVQVAELTRREQQLRMVLDSLATDDVIARLEQLLREAVAHHDDLAVWHLTSSGWPALYLESRGLRSWVGQWDQASSSIAAGVLGEDAAAARQLLDAVDNADYNLATALLAADHFVRFAFDGLTLVVAR